MEISRAIKSIEALSEGINPSTGEILPNESPYNDPEVIRALFCVLKYTYIKKKRLSKKTVLEKQQQNIEKGLPKNAGFPWTDVLKEELTSRFKSDEDINSLSKHFERTKGAIISELKRQGLITPEEAEQLAPRSTLS